MSNQRPGSTIEFKNDNKNKKSLIGFNEQGICNACEYKRVKDNDIDWEEREFELYKNQSNKYIDKYSDNNLEKRCKDNLIIYNNLLNYFPDKNNNEVIDTISHLDKEVIIDKKININSDILPNLNKSSILNIKNSEIMH